MFALIATMFSHASTRHRRTFGKIAVTFLSCTILCLLVPSGMATAQSAIDSIQGAAPTGGLGFGINGVAIEGNLLANSGHFLFPPLGLGPDSPDSLSDWVGGPAGPGVGLLTAAGLENPALAGNPNILLDSLGSDVWNSGADNSFVQGAKVDENPNSQYWGLSQVNNKQDINRVGLAIITDPASGHRWLLMSGDRLSTNGDAFIAFYIFRNEDSLALLPIGSVNKNTGKFSSKGTADGRTIGDLLITMALTQGGSVPELVLEMWSDEGGTPHWKDTTSLIAPGGALAGSGFIATNNDSNVAVPYGAFGADNPSGSQYQYVPRAFLEAAIDFSAIVGILEPCASFNKILPVTKESQSPSATIVDFLEPIDVPLQTPKPSFTASEACAGSATTFTNTSSDVSASYTIDFGDGSGVIAFPFSPATSHTYAVAGTYDVVVNGLNVTTGCTDSLHKSVVVNPNPTCSISPSTAEVCAGFSQSFTSTPSGGTGPYTHHWSTGATTASITVSTAGTYTDTVTDAKGCQTTCEATLTVNPNPTCSIAPSAAEICAGFSQTFTSTPSGGTGPYTHRWSTGATTASITVSTAGTYTDTVTDAKGCTTTCQATLTVNPNPTCSIEPSTAEICTGGSQTFTSTPSGGTGPYTHHWSTGATTASITVGTAGTYTDTVTDAKGCRTTCAATLTVNANPSCSIDPASAEICQGSSQQFCGVPSGGTGPFTHKWSNGGTTSCITVSTAGTYTDTITDSKGCQSVCSATLTVNPNPTCSIAPSTAEICAGFSQTFTSTPSGGTGPYTHSWSNGATTASITVGTAGTYTDTVTDAKGCTSTCQATLTVNPNPTCSIDPATAEICAGFDQTFTSTPSGGTGPYTHHWSTGATTASITVSVAGTYTDTVTDSKGCKTTCQATLTVNPNPSCSIDPASAEICQGFSQQFCGVPSGGAGPFKHKWSTGDTTTCITVSTAGTYSDTITDAKGCVSVCSATLTVNPNPTCSIDPASAAICSGSSQTFTSTPSGGTGPYTHHWSTGATTASITVGTAGTYTDTVTDAKGCTSTCAATLTVNPLPDVTATGGTITCLEPAIQLMASSSDTNVTYSWSGPNGFSTTQQNPMASDSGVYTVTVTDTVTGCSNSDTAHIAVVIPTIGDCGAAGPITSGFELDGNIQSSAPNPPDDWDSVYTGGANPTSTTGVVDDFPSNADDYFQVGTKDITDIPDWHYNVQGVPDKDDILHGGAVQYNGQLYFFADRYDVNGDAQIGFWFLKDTVRKVDPGNSFTGHHEIGDLLILSNFIKGGGSPVIFAYEWVGSGGSDGPLDTLSLSAANSFATVNTQTLPSPWPFKAKNNKVPAGQIPPGAFFEGGIDLACLTGAGVSACFSNFILETRSSQSVTASLKDFLIGRFTASLNPATIHRLAANFDQGEQAGQQIPAAYALYANYPNPFNPTTVIRYDLPDPSVVKLSVFNVLGQEVATLVHQEVNAGYQSVEWNTENAHGVALPSGIYFYRLQATSLKNGEQFVKISKMVLLK